MFNNNDRQHDSRWTRVNVLFGGRVKTDSHRWSSRRFFLVALTNKMLNLVSSAFVATWSLRSTAPSPSSTASHWSHTNHHFSSVCKSRTSTRKRYQAGDLPALLCQIWTSLMRPRVCGTVNKNWSISPRPNLARFGSFNIRGSLSLIEPYSWTNTSAVVLLFCWNPVCSVIS